MAVDDDTSEPQVRQRLTAWRDELQDLSASGSAAAAAVELDQQRVGRLSRMDAMQAQAMAGATQARRQLLLRRIQRALLRLDDGSYGDCLECGAAIASGRLQVDPAAEHCLECADALQ